MLGEALSGRDWKQFHTAEEARWPTPAHLLGDVGLWRFPFAPPRPRVSGRPAQSPLHVGSGSTGGGARPVRSRVGTEESGGPVELTGGRAVFFCEYFSRHHIEWRDP